MDAAAPSPLDYAPLSGLSAPELAFRTLWQQISQGTLAPGALFTEERLASSLSISRTPLREAVRRLEELGLIEREASRGLRVTLLSMREMLDLSATREAIEGALAAAAAGRVRAGEASVARLEAIHDRLQRVIRVHDAELALAIGSEFHAEIRRLAGNRSAGRFHEQLLLALERYRYLAARAPDRPELVFAEHDAILAALRAGDAAGAESLMRRHIAEARDVYARILSIPLGAA
ncbi:MAG: GntR family transcriptional regulator [Acetobacteraceae bacterium]